MDRSSFEGDGHGGIGIGGGHVYCRGCLTPLSKRNGVNSMNV
jgi:hypothetical protein